MQNGMFKQQQTEVHPQQALEQPVIGQPQNILRGEDVQKLLLQRVAQMDEYDLEILDSIINEETISMLVKLLPELAILFKEASAFQGDGFDDGSQKFEDDDIVERDNMNPLVSEGLMR